MSPPARSPWHLPGLVDEVAAAVGELEAALRLEQAPHGLDEWDERTLQRALARELRRAHEVALEVHYPSTLGRKLSHRPRCDLVLAPRGRPLHQGESLPFDLCPAAEALWLELKVAHQLRPGGARDGRYGEQWRRHLIADLRKMAAEPLIESAVLLLVAFTEDEEILQRDLGTFEARLARHDVLAGFRQVRVVPIQERIGHRVCGVALWPTLQR